MCSISTESGNESGSIDEYSDPTTDERNCTETGGIGFGQEGSDTNLASPYYYLPLWDDVHSNNRWVFLLHNYGFACLFFFLAFYAFFSILNLRSQLSSRPYMSTINSFLCLLGLSRAIGLFIDPYGLMKTMPILMGALLWDLGFPCLISSFSLIQIAFLQLTQPVPQHKLCQMSPDSSSVFIISQWKYDKPMLDIGPEKLRKKTCLSVVITIHFVTVLASAIYTAFNDLLQVKLVTQLVFAVWGLILCGSFLYAGNQGILGHPSGHSTEGSSVTSGKEGKGLAAMGMGLLAPGQNIAASLTAALAPTLLHAATPKIKITDENDRTVSVTSDLSHLNDAEGGNGGQHGNRPLTPVPGPSSNKKDAGGEDGNNSSGNYVRPPSPVLPRRKSSGSSRVISGAAVASGGSGLVTSSAGSHPRRQSLNRRASGFVDEKDANRKKSLTWSESEVSNNSGHKSKSKSKSLGDKDNNYGEARDSRSRSSQQSRKSMDNNADGTFPEKTEGRTESLLSAGGPDYTLQSILSHIAYVNQTALDYRLSRKLSRKNQVQKVIKFTSITAILGALLCIAEMVRILSPYGLLASTSHPPPLWPWFALQTVCRTIEFSMGATIANITKQPVKNPHHYAYSIRHKTHRESLYL